MQETLARGERALGSVGHGDMRGHAQRSVGRAEGWQEAWQRLSSSKDGHPGRGQDASWGPWYFWQGSRRAFHTWTGGHSNRPLRAIHTVPRQMQLPRLVFLIKWKSNQISHFTYSDGKAMASLRNQKLMRSSGGKCISFLLSLESKALSWILLALIQLSDKPSPAQD